MTRWQDPSLQESLADMSARGMSAAQIAAELGETRDAVKSAMTRYGLFAVTGRRLTNISGMSRHDQSRQHDDSGR